MELNTFERLVHEGGEVIAAGLRQRIEQAEKLVFLKENECVGVAAIKNPNAKYKSGVFTKAGISEKNNVFKYELGWLYVIPSARGNGFGRELMIKVTDFLNGTGCFATTRENNKAMHRLLIQYSFNPVGSAYQSDNGDYSLVLYLNML